MEFDFAVLPAHDRYKLLAASVIPRPIALVTTISAEGVVNAAPYSFFNVLGQDPPIVALGIESRPQGPLKDTMRNVHETGHFVINLVDEAMAEAMSICSTDFPPEVDELKEAGLTAVPSTRISCPRIAEAPVSLECTVFQELALRAEGKRSILLGEVVTFHIRDGLVDPDRMYVDSRGLHLIGRFGGQEYVRLHDVFSLPRFTVDSWAARKAAE